MTLDFAAVRLETLWFHLVARAPASRPMPGVNNLLCVHQACACLYLLGGFTWSSPASGPSSLGFAGRLSTPSGARCRIVKMGGKRNFFDYIGPHWPKVGLFAPGAVGARPPLRFAPLGEAIAVAVILELLFGLVPFGSGSFFLSRGTCRHLPNSRNVDHVKIRKPEPSGGLVRA